MRITTRYDGSTPTIGGSVVVPRPLHPDVGNFVYSMATNFSYVCSSNEINALNDLVWSFVELGVWTGIVAAYALIGSTSTTQVVNLKDPADSDAAFRLAFLGGGWTHSSNGATPNGTTSYADTFLSPNASLTNNNTHISFYSRTSTAAANQRDFACFVGGSDPCLSLGTNSGVIVSDQNTFALRVSASVSSADGYWIGTRTASNNTKLYRNGGLLGTNTGTSATALPVARLFLGAANVATNSTSRNPTNYSSKQFCFATVGASVTDSQAFGMSRAVQSFLTRLGRAVNV